MLKKAVFLDRDGVLIEDVGLLTCPKDFHLLPGVPQALSRLRSAGYYCLVVTNQTVISRGMCSEEDVLRIHQKLDMLLASDRKIIDRYYVCPHHPEATIAEYRKDCTCRKPLPGMLVQGSVDYDLSLPDCWMIGDRISDIIAGKSAGCRTIQVLTGKHDDAPIRSGYMPEEFPDPDWRCPDLQDAVAIILENT